MTQSPSWRYTKGFCVELSQTYAKKYFKVKRRYESIGKEARLDGYKGIEERIKDEGTARECPTAIS
jgi:hypothetical protein